MDVTINLPKIKTLIDLIDFTHQDKSTDVKNYIIEQALSIDNNKGKLWEDTLSKAMASHTILLGGNTKGRDFTDSTDAKFSVFYKKSDGKWEASVSNIRHKIGPLRVCLCYPGENYHRLFFLFIPYEAYQKYTVGSSCLKFKISPRGNITSPLSKYVCSFEDVCRPHN